MLFTPNNIEKSAECQEKADDDFDELLQLAFSEGCGHQLADVRGWQYHQYLTDKYSSVKTEITAIDIWQQRAIKLGTHSLSFLLGAQPNGDFLLTKQFDTPNDNTSAPSPEDTAIIQILGEELIEKAKQALTPESVEMAAKWSTANEDERVGILCDLFQIYKSKNDDDENCPVDDWGRKQYRPDNSLPAFFGQWPNTNTSVNCLGMSMMLAGWAELAQADYLFTTTIRHGYDNLWLHYRNMMLSAVDNLKHRDLECPQALEEVLSGDLNNSERVLADFIKDFHHSVVIRLNGNYWMHIDPYMCVICLMKDEFATSDIFETLNKTKRITPGLTVTRSTISSYNEGFDIEKQFYQTAFEVSLLMESELQTAVPQTAAELLQLIVDFCDTKLKTHIETNPFYKYFASLNVWLDDILGEVKTEENTDTADEANEEKYFLIHKKLLDRFDRDEAYRRRVINDIIVAPIKEAVFHTADAIEEFTQIYVLAEPSIEFANPNFMIGLLTLNQLRSWSNYGNKYTSRRLVEQTSSQVLWHEAMKDQDPSMSPKMLEMVSGLQKLDPGLLHPSCRLVLASLR